MNHMLRHDKRKVLFAMFYKDSKWDSFLNYGFLIFTNPEHKHLNITCILLINPYSSVNSNEHLGKMY
jgi:hypothetical protein